MKAPCVALGEKTAAGTRARALSSRLLSDREYWELLECASYSRVQEIKALAGIVGEDELGKTDRACLEFGRQFERQFITQGPEENRTIEQSLDLCWQLLSTLPETELTRVSRQEIKEHMKKK